MSDSMSSFNEQKKLHRVDGWQDYQSFDKLLRGKLPGQPSSPIKKLLMRLTNILQFSERYDLISRITSGGEDANEWCSRLGLFPRQLEIQNMRLAVLCAKGFCGDGKNSKKLALKHQLNVTACGAPSMYFLACEIVRSGLQLRININLRKKSSAL